MFTDLIVTTASRKFNAPQPPLDWSRINRVLLIRLRSIGDTVLLTPCLNALKSWRPDLHLAVLMEPLSAPLLSEHPLVDEVIVSGRSLGSRARVLQKLRGSRFDVAFNIHGGPTGMFLARLSGASKTVAFHEHHYSWLLGLRAPDPDKFLGRSMDNIHSVENQLALLNWVGVPGPTTPPRLQLVVSPKAKAAICRKLTASGFKPCDVEAPAAGQRQGTQRNPGGFAVIAPAVVPEPKRWPAEGFARVADHLKDVWDLPSIIIAGPGQESMAADVIAASITAPTLVSGLTLAELTALLSMSTFFIGNDSGPMHIAAAFDRPIVAVFGSTRTSVWHPWTKAAYRTVESDKRRSGAGTPRLAITTIPAGRVIKAVDDVLLESIKSAPA